MSANVTGLFADMRSALEDVHAIAVEGQQQGHSPDMQRVLLQNMCSALQRVQRTARLVISNLGEAE